jgi:hypothetical protein
MKFLFALPIAIGGLFPVFMYHGCNSNKASSVAQVADKSLDLGDSIQFSSHVQPIMQKRCTPCHFTGGKMYARMPFDKDTTIINHQASILKRIKDEEENSVIRKFLRQNKNAMPAD